MIEFDIPRESEVSLKVYNILGAEVASIIDHMMLGQGVYNEQFNGNSLASGIYFYRLEAKGANGKVFISTKKFLLLK
jgi:hypothetical protein